MLNNLPQNIINYLVNELPPFTGILIIRTDANGQIIDFHGPHNEYLRSKPETGKSIHEYVPALFAMIPTSESPIVLNKIKSNNSVYADIHIIETGLDEYWMFFVDQNHQVEGIREILQLMNQSNLKNETVLSSDNSGLFNPYEVFDDLGLIVNEDNSGIISTNIPKWFQILAPGYETGSTINFTDVFPYLEVFMYEANEFWKTVKTGKSKSGIWTETFLDGTEIALNAFAIINKGIKYLLVRPMDDEIDKEQLALQMAREQKLAYEKLEKAEKKLKILLEYKDKFVSIVSHDLRSPVSAVLGITDMLINDESEISKLNDFYKDMIFSINDEMIRLLDYNDKLYHWSNLELGNFKIVKKKTSLKKLIETSERTIVNKLEAKNIGFSSNISKDHIVNVDTTLFLQVLNNLLSNAVKFTPENGNIAINISSKGELKIEVVDSGIGMPQNISDNIFSGYVRNSTMGTDGEKGTGLGLGIVNKIIEAHGFTIDVKSEPGKGSSFIIGIPK
jgi:signal transduction histidine kinase